MPIDDALNELNPPEKKKPPAEGSGSTEKLESVVGILDKALDAMCPYIRSAQSAIFDPNQVRELLPFMRVGQGLTWMLDDIPREEFIAFIAKGHAETGFLLTQTDLKSSVPERVIVYQRGDLKDEQWKAMPAAVYTTVKAVFPVNHVNALARYTRTRLVVPTANFLSLCMDHGEAAKKLFAMQEGQGDAFLFCNLQPSKSAVASNPSEVYFQPVDISVEDLAAFSRSTKTTLISDMVKELERLQGSLAEYPGYGDESRKRVADTLFEGLKRNNPLLVKES